jgi:MFS family permease
LDRNKLNIYVFYALAFLQGIVFYGPIATIYRQARGISVLEITLIESISLLLMIVLEIPWGWVADRIGYRKTMLACNFLFFLSKIIFYQSTSFFGFLAERLLLSVVLSGLSGCDSAYLYLSKGNGKSQKVFGLYQGMGTAGLIVASASFSLFIGNDYALSAGMTIITYGIASAITLLLKEVKPPVRQRKSVFQQLKIAMSSFLSHRKFILFLLAAALLAETNQTVTVFLGQLQYVRSSISPRYMGYIHILVTIAGLISFCSHSAARILGESRLIKATFTIGALSCVSLAFFVNPWVSILGVILLRMAASLFAPLHMDMQNRQVEIDDRATMLSVYSTILNLIGVVTNLAFGKTAQWDIRYAMGMGAAFCLAGLLLYAIWQQKPVKSKRVYDGIS